MSELIREYEGIPEEIPLLGFRPIKMATNHINPELYDWIIFTSSVTVDTFFSEERQFKHFPKIAVIGIKTEKTLNKYGYRSEFMPDTYVAEHFVEQFAPYVKKGMKILIPKGSLARNYIFTGLTDQGAHVDELIIYETIFPLESRALLLDKLMNNQLDILLFTSPSTIDHFMQIVSEGKLEKQIEHCFIGCIGPVSKKRAEAYGLTVNVMPERYTVNDLINSMVDYVNHKRGI
ncbi:uroporphyrinogen-III synthase [Cytobacillus purgationiresistens]|uniref:uroporphyrinogen-III synthase n=1 Tax=Cytobacillus purgationiresistens TaxID=863449 RepID=UPI0027D8AAAF|nr:uroporphyrinogen-III synthase [Cytobacillus purgationiresistens]